MTTQVTGATKTESALPVGSVVPPVVESAADLTQSTEVTCSLEQLACLARQANEIARHADDGENPEAENDKRRANEAADTAKAGGREILAAAARGDGAAVKGAIQRSLSTTRTAVSNANDAVEDHEHPVGVSSSERVAHEASLKAKESAKVASKRKASEASLAKKVLDKAPAKGAVAAAVMAQADGDDEDEDDRAQGAKPKAPTYGVRREKDDTIGEVVSKQTKRAYRGGKAAVRGTGVSVAEGTGYISAKKAATAGKLAQRMENAQTEAEYAEADRQWGKAVDRNVFGSSFLEQEIGDALSKLQGNKAAREIANRENWISNDISVSQVVSRLRANGYVTGEKGWNWQHDKTSEWSHSAVKRIDRDGNGQLEAHEIAYAMTHKYGVKPAPAAAPAKAVGVTQAQVNRARDIVDTNNDGKVTQGEINAALKAAGVTLAQMDKDKNGAISNAELVAIANMLPRNYGAAPAKGK